jgi:hypothetical protein
MNTAPYLILPAEAETRLEQLMRWELDRFLAWNCPPSSMQSPAQIGGGEMPKRKGAARADLFRNNAQAFDVCAELIFLMETKPLWLRIEDGVKTLSKGINLETEVYFPIDQLIENLEALKLLVDQRRG